MFETSFRLLAGLLAGSALVAAAGCRTETPAAEKAPLQVVARTAPAGGAPNIAGKASAAPPAHATPGGRAAGAVHPTVPDGRGIGHRFYPDEAPSGEGKPARP